MLVAVALQRVERGFSRVTEADFHVPPAPASTKVAVFKQVEHGFTAGGKSPVVSLSLLVALCPRNLRGTSQILMILKSVTHADTTEDRKNYFYFFITAKKIKSVMTKNKEK